MRRLAASLVAGALLASPALAQDWGSYFNMGTFAAGGGSDANGWLHFECAGPDSGFSTAGRPHISVRVRDGVELDKKTLAAGVWFWVGDGASYDVPVQLEQGSSTVLVYDYSAQSVPGVLDFIAALRRGERFGLVVGAENVASITLEGSHAALEYVEGCIANAQ